MEENNDKKVVEVPAKFKDIVEQIEKMSVLELNELVKLFEEKFGVSAQATVVAGGGAGEVAEVKDTFSVTLTSAGEQKVQVIKAVKDKLGLGLKDAKDLVDAVPSVLKAEAKKEEADEIKAAVEAAGGKVEIK
ncbi:MAG: 50S ribosomal protein L7/L12 [Candidatus Vogelbacteria bacterium]|nr:50S ribosomal protein L7/L12 [Candidatus Vogelbacteria bacterium]